MPVITGYDVAKHVRGRTEPKYAELPLLALTAYDKKDMEDAVLESGMNGMLQKPFLEKELYDLICTYVDIEKDEAITPNEDLAQENLAPKTQVDFTTIYELFGEDKADLKHYLQAAVNDLSRTILDFEEAEKDLSLSLYKDAVHKLISIRRMLGLKELSSLLESQRQLLEDEKFDAFLEVGEKRKLLMESIKAMVQKEMEK
jgi:CheY-like chemotaxis protein